jgi:hypothetical protein
MRRLIALILCLLIPLQGFATLKTASVPCPMQAGMSMNVDMDDLTEAMEDCCNDAATFERTGEMCKSGKNLQAPSSWMPPPSPMEFQAHATPPLREPVWREHPPGQPTRLWRPPTSV